MLLVNSVAAVVSVDWRLGCGMHFAQREKDFKMCLIGGVWYTQRASMCSSIISTTAYCLSTFHYFQSLSSRVASLSVAHFDPPIVDLVVIAS